MLEKIFLETANIILMSKKLETVKFILKENAKPLILSLLWLAFLISIVVFLVLRFTRPSPRSSPKVSSFEECAQIKDSRIQESYPERCITRDGLSFTRQLSAEEKQNLLPPSGFQE